MLVHRAFVYGSPDELAVVAAPFLAEGLKRGEHVFAATRTECHPALRRALAERGAELELEDAERWQTRPAARLVALRRMVDGGGPRPALRVLHEPVWRGSEALEREWGRFEAIVNVILAEVPLQLICVYDGSRLPAHVLAHVRRSHPELIEAGAVRPSHDYRAPATYLGPVWRDAR